LGYIGKEKTRKLKNGDSNGISFLVYWEGKNKKALLANMLFKIY